MLTIIILNIIFWLCILAVLHTYIFFPVILSFIYRITKHQKTILNKKCDSVPISILIAAYNEEKVIADKIESIFQSDYPKDLIEVWVGSDNSNDATNEILKNLEQKYPQLHPIFFSERIGKIRIINQLVKKANANILIITDANVMFDKNTINELCASMTDEKIGLVDTRMIHTGLQNDGISKQENIYISNEVKIKFYEGEIWGCMMGPFGGCYAVRKALFKPIPDNFLVDDFFINMQVLQQGYKAINNPKAIVIEDVSNDLKHEFKRKIRIATGDFQNLHYFLPFTYKKFFTSIGFCFISHKIIRWFTPHLIILVFIVLSILVLLGNQLYLYLLLAGITLIMFVFLERILSKININVMILRLITHFFYMNLALLIGFFRFMKGVKSSIWTPTPRLQGKNN